MLTAFRAFARIKSDSLSIFLDTEAVFKAFYIIQEKHDFDFDLNTDIFFNEFFYEIYEIFTKVALTNVYNPFTETSKNNLKVLLHLDIECTLFSTFFSTNSSPYLFYLFGHYFFPINSPWAKNLWPNNFNQNIFKFSNFIPILLAVYGPA